MARVGTLGSFFSFELPAFAWDTHRVSVPFHSVGIVYDGMNCATRLPFSFMVGQLKWYEYC